MGDSKWEEEREELLTRLRRAEQIALESQAQAAVYLDLLESCNEAARRARDSESLEPLKSLDGNLMFYATPRETDEWGKHFLNAYRRDAGWLEHTKSALEQIKTDAEKLPEDNEINAELKRRIIAAAEDGLITHI